MSEAADFLRGVMHDKAAPLRLRVKAAGDLMKLEGPDGPPKLRPVTIVYIIGGIGPFLDPSLRDTWRSSAPRNNKKC